MLLSSDAAQFYEQIEQRRVLLYIDIVTEFAADIGKGNYVHVSKEGKLYGWLSKGPTNPEHNIAVVDTQLINPVLKLAFEIRYCTYGSKDGALFEQVRGIPIGGLVSMASVNASFPLMEGRWTPKRQQQHGFPLERPGAILHRRYVDDIIQGSATLCMECTKARAESIYQNLPWQHEDGDGPHKQTWLDFQFEAEDDTRVVIGPKLSEKDFVIGTKDKASKQVLPSSEAFSASVQKCAQLQFAVLHMFFNCF